MHSQRKRSKENCGAGSVLRKTSSLLVGFRKAKIFTNLGSLEVFKTSNYSGVDVYFTILTFLIYK